MVSELARWVEFDGYIIQVGRKGVETAVGVLMSACTYVYISAPAYIYNIHGI